MNILLDVNFDITNLYDWTGYNWQNFEINEIVWNESEDGGEAAFRFGSVDFVSGTVQLVTFHDEVMR